MAGERGRRLKSPWLWGAAALLAVAAAALLWYPPLWQKSYAPQSPGTQFAAGQHEDRLDLNTAPAEELQLLPGVGEQKAHAIVAYRQQNGPFHSVEELENVPGIGPKMVEQIRGHVVVG